MLKPLIVDLPYPNFEDVKENLKDGYLLAPLYSGLHGEITAILQYVYHHFYFEKYEDVETADILTCISLAEMKHLDMLGKIMLALGVDPIFSLNPPRPYDFYSTCKVAYGKSPQKMILDDITGELTAIEEYESINRKVKDETVSALLSRIIIDEQLHVKVLKERFEKLK